jgi:uncharacterized coiled-coil DUF342 family protein
VLNKNKGGGEMREDLREDLREEVRELAVIIDDVVEKLVRVVKIANEMYFLRGLMNEVYQKVLEVQGRIKKVRGMVDEEQAS